MLVKNLAFFKTQACGIVSAAKPIKMIRIRSVSSDDVDVKSQIAAPIIMTVAVGKVKAFKKVCVVN